jgi:beta-glucosidase
MLPQRVKDRLPSFTEAEKQLLKGSHDFFGLNHYTSEYVYNDPHPSGEGFAADQGTASTRVKDGKLIGPQADSNWLYVVPWGIRKLLNWIGTSFYATCCYLTLNSQTI